MNKKILIGAIVAIAVIALVMVLIPTQETEKQGKTAEKTGNVDEKQKLAITNPLIPEPGMSDPHMLVVDDTCYVFTGHDVGVGISDWVMPDWRIYKSGDLQSWEHVGTIDPKDNYMGEGNTSCWAGDVVERNGKYYWYFSNHHLNTGVMVADKPEGPYADALGKPLVDSFDPTVFVDDDNTPYIVYGRTNYKIARLKESMIELDEEPKTIVIEKPTYFPDMDKNSLHKRNGIYYLSCSGYYATSKNLYGPYVAQGRVGTGWELDTAYGHGDFFVWKGDWYHVWCKYKDREKDRIRDSYIAPVIYDQDGMMRDDLSQLNAMPDISE
ncbi:MAG: family 43 glycosylhydrolase [Leeuwenhoekiella sp.]